VPIELCIAPFGLGLLGWRSAAKLLSHHEPRRIAVNIAKLPDFLRPK
jgi:hypothetical protein